MARMDELIKKDVIDQMVRDVRVDASSISVEVSNGTVTLSGEVPTYYSRTCAYEDTQGISGVLDVINQLIVKYPSTKTVPTDSEIEFSLKSRLLADPDIDLIDLELIVSEGMVTLRGTVDAYWKKIRAENLAETQPGVVLIENHIAVVPSGDFMDKSIAEDIVYSLEAKAAVNADDVNVKVRDGEVTLTGTVPNWSARLAAFDAAFYTAGVSKVDNLVAVTGS